MKKLCICIFCCFWLGVLPLLADEIAPLQLNKGETYQLRTVETIVIRDANRKNPVVRKAIVRERYDLFVLEAHRKKGFLVEMCKRQYDFISLKKDPGSSRWQEVALEHSDIVSSRWKDKMSSGNMCPGIDSVCRVRLSPSLKVISIECGCLGDEGASPGDIAQLQDVFSSGKMAVYRFTDTSFLEEHPQGILFMDDWNTKIYRTNKEIRKEIRFSRVNTQPFAVIREGDKDESIIWPQTNTTLRGEVKGVEGDTVIKITFADDFPVYNKNVYRIPVIGGKFEFRLNLSESLDYLRLGKEQFLYLEAGDDLFVVLDSLNDKRFDYRGLGAGNNRYYAEAGASWGFSLYHIDREKMCSKQYYAKLEEKADYFRQKMEARKAELTPGFYQYMLNCFKYRPVYRKLMADPDSTVGEFDCMKGVEICNPLAVLESEYMSVLRHIILLKIPRLLQDIGGAQTMYDGMDVYDRAGMLLDGRVLNAFLVHWISEKLVSDFDGGKILYNRYKQEYQKSPYTEMLDEQYRKAAVLVPGFPAPDFVLQDTSGKQVALSDFKGKVVYIDFWRLGCGPCMYEFKTAVPGLKEYFKDKEVVFLNIIANCNIESWKKLIADYHITGVNLMDTKEGVAAKSYMVSGFPHYVLVGKDGKLINISAARPSEGAEGVISKALE